jgi:hypothetical protein
VKTSGSPRQGICQACHDPGKAGTESTKYWRWDGTDEPDGAGGAASYTSDHNDTLPCSDCHAHDADFIGAGEGGACASCHGTVVGENIFGQMSDTTATYDAGDGQGLRASNYKHLIINDAPADDFTLTRQVDVFSGASDVRRTCTRWPTRASRTRTSSRTTRARASA